MSGTRSCLVLVCTTHRFGPEASSCGARGADAVLAALKRAADQGLLGDCTVRRGPCLGHCTQGPNARVVGGAMLHGLTAEDMGRVVAALGEKAEPSDRNT